MDQAIKSLNISVRGFKKGLQQQFVAAMSTVLGSLQPQYGRIIIWNFITISRIVMKLQTRLQFKALIPLNRPSAICLMFVLNKLLCQRKLITCNNQQMQVFCSMKLKLSNQSENHTVDVGRIGKALNKLQFKQKPLLPIIWIFVYVLWPEEIATIISRIYPTEPKMTLFS